MLFVIGIVIAIILLLFYVLSKVYILGGFDHRFWSLETLSMIKYDEKCKEVTPLGYEAFRDRVKAENNWPATLKLVIKKNVS